MSAQQQFVAAGGATLLGLYLVTSGEGHAIRHALDSPNSSKSGASDEAILAMKHTGLAVLGIGGAVMLSGLSTNAGNVFAVVVVGLLVLFVLNHYGASGSSRRAPHAPIKTTPGVPGGRMPVSA